MKLLILAGVFGLGACGDCPPSARYQPGDRLFGRYEAPSFDNACTASADCMIGGCGGEVCAAEPIVTTCEVIEPPEGSCECVQGACVWATTECLPMELPTGPDAGVVDSGTSEPE